MNMKKSTQQLLIGIAMIVVALAADLLTSKVFDFSDPNGLGIAQIAVIVVLGVLLIGGIVLIVMSRKLAKKEKEEAKQ